MKRKAMAGSSLAAVVMLAGCGGNPFEAEDQGPVVPGFSAIQDRMWDAMLTADTVSIEGQVEASEADVDEMFEEIDEDQTGDLTITGAVDGSDSEMTFSAGEVSFTQRAVDGTEYFRGEDFASLLMSELDDEFADLVEEEFIDSVVADQWVRFSTDDGGAVFSAEDFITTWQRELDDDGVGALPGTEETRDGADVYVYATEDESTEFVVAAEGAPYLLEMRDDESHYVFSQWNEAQRPEEPENVTTVEEIFVAIAQDNGWSTEDLGGEAEQDAGEDGP
ncbi:hypothetical protein [Nesterenkonia lutea]|uniref:Lipoprotein n=1 Tax=Nesterenkonia lutea TaxID=272919 RepID=A0ABR9JBF3_9MICC|nr:hypothetical protein [Nesterenkonia lutea]MBE1523255.1 hypothetical protein [Nesterenkonia lutea]